MDCNPPGSSVHGFLQARILEWVAIFFSSGSSRPRNQTYISCIAGGFFTIGAVEKPSVLEVDLYNLPVEIDAVFSVCVMEVDSLVSRFAASKADCA